ncbi:MAG: M24 family metallopeptidase [Candidatus Thorarchaeota archaeon]|nr:M24 family metallopeptidase [Candidatus Thorarchaeota archaeon]
MLRRIEFSLIALFLLFIIAMAPVSTYLTKTPIEPAIEDSVILSVIADDAQKAAKITSSAFEVAKSILQQTYSEALTQGEVASYLEALMRAEGADSHLAFPTLVMSGPELSEPHGNSLDDRYHSMNPQLEKVVMIDMGCQFNGICTDITRTYFFEGVDEEVLSAYTAVVNAQEAAIAEIRAGKPISELTAIIKSHLRDYLRRDDVYFHEYWGHGVGFYVHEKPVLWRGNEEVLSEGQVLAIEPGLWFEDGWAVRVEDVVLVTEDGFSVLSNVSKSVDQVMIQRNTSNIDFRLHMEDFSYGSRSRISVEFSREYEMIAKRVEYHDGYRWNTMNSLSSIEFYFEFLFNSSYSSIRTLILRTITENNTFYRFLNTETTLQSDEEFRIERGISSNHLEQSPRRWTISHEGAQMIRIRFSVFDAPDLDQMLIIDSRGMVIDDMRADACRDF